ncbi:MAG: NrfD/PsrC family molybdoenzyme membrane anchor subunit [Polyangiaceae bacterium]
MKTESYYGRSIVKPHQWKPEIPLYFWVGGTAGAASVACVLARMRKAHGLATVHKRVALAGAMLAPILLTRDLGVPHRFYKMLRVFKPTSPMSVGSWILTAFGGTLTASTLAELMGWNVVSAATEVLAALMGPAVASYTAVLISNTATPIWHEAYGELPFVFVASGIAGSGALGVFFAPPHERGSARRAMLLGQLAVLGSMKYMEKSLGEPLSEPYHKGKSGAIQRASTILGMAAAGIGLVGGKSGFLGRLAAGLTIASGILERFAILEAGKESARDPKYVVATQHTSDAKMPTSPNGVTYSREPTAILR